MAFISKADITGLNPHEKRFVYLFDRLTGTTTLMSRKTGAAGAVGTHCDNPSVAEDGPTNAIVVFETAGSLDPLDTNAFTDIYARRTINNTTVLLSRGNNGGVAVVANGASIDAAISEDGQFAAFTSAATNLVSGDTNARQDVFRVGTSGNEFAERASLNNAGAQSTTTNFTTAGGTGLGVGKVISADGSMVLFHGAPCDWDAGPFDCGSINCLCADSDGNCSPCTAPRQQVYLRHLDPVGPQTFRVSRVESGGTFLPGNNISRRAAFRNASFPNGCWVVFSTTATNFPADADAVDDVFIFKVGAIANINLPGNCERVSVPTGGAGSPGQSTAPMAADVQFVVFQSAASNLVAGDTNALVDIFVTEVGDPPFLVTRVNTSTAGAQATGGGSTNPDISNRCAPLPDVIMPGNCDLIYVYESLATNLDPMDANARKDDFEGLSRSFIRADVNSPPDRRVNDDDLALMGDIISGGLVPPCMKAADVNDDALVDVTDLLALSNFINSGTPTPPPPSPLPGGMVTGTCGKDRTTDGLSSCTAYIPLDGGPCRE